MIERADDVPEGAVLETDLCVVGAGAAGIALALDLARGRTRVLVLESGDDAPDPATQALYAGEVADAALHSPPDRYRQRRFGGSTTIWGGRCMPFDPIDFEARPWIPGSGWPIGPEALAAHYPAANALLEAGDFAYTAEAAFPEGGLPPLIADFASPHFTQGGLERFSLPTDLGRRYRARLAKSPVVRVLLRANAVELRTRPGGRVVDALAVRTLAGRAFTVRARRVVLAAGGLETPRLLLASCDHNPAGLGNARDLVGRHYMCHVAGTDGALRLNGPARDVFHGYGIAADGVYCRRRLQLRPEVQRRHEVGNIVMRLHHPRIPDPAHRTGALSALYLAKRIIPYEYAKRLTGDGPAAAGDLARHVRNVTLDPFGTAGFLLHWLARRTLATRKFPTVIIRPRANLYSLDFHAEQVPQRDSRVTLGAERDALGMRRIRVDWRYAEQDLRTVTEAFRLLADDLARSGRGRLDYEPAGLAAACLRDGAYGGHHVGTARMGATPADGVVDPDGRVHGTENLYVAGSAVFPTSSQANPTLTIVAMSLRLAEHLRGCFAREEGTPARAA